ncbi:MAG TPA: V-type ATP synthase subunit F [Acidiferrobacterales bacterium]|jgi:vacuolar-type H+-ATPase subunit F/Vma7
MSQAPETTVPATRMIALGSAALIEGFGLIGVETRPDATAEQLETLLAELVRNQDKALLFLEDALARGDGPWLRRVREEGGRIVIAEVPPLNAPEDYHPPVEALVLSILGPQALEERS